MCWSMGRVTINKEHHVADSYGHPPGIQDVD